MIIIIIIIISSSNTVSKKLQLSSKLDSDWLIDWLIL